MIQTKTENLKNEIFSKTKTPTTTETRKCKNCSQNRSR